MDSNTQVSAESWTGQSLPRVEDAALLAGRGRGIDDLGTPPATPEAASLRSPAAPAEIMAIKTARLGAESAGEPAAAAHPPGAFVGEPGASEGGPARAARRWAASRERIWAMLLDPATLAGAAEGALGFSRNPSRHSTQDADR